MVTQNLLRTNEAKYVFWGKNDQICVIADADTGQKTYAICAYLPILSYRLI